ncbi:MAG: hypothetical protein ACYTFW_25750, partial [Planctomycetota bacterium]
MAEKVPQLTVCEVPPVAPSEWCVSFMIGPVGCGPQPKVPVEGLRHRRAVRRSIGLRSVCWLGRSSEVCAQPYVDLAHRTDGTRLYKFHHATVVAAGV